MDGNEMKIGYLSHDLRFGYCLKCYDQFTSKFNDDVPVFEINLGVTTSTLPLYSFQCSKCGNKTESTSDVTLFEIELWETAKRTGGKV